MKKPRGTKVACNGCTACCRGDNVRLYPEHEDVPGAYLTEEAVYPATGETVTILRHGPSGDCVYLGAKGCTIHDRRPYACRAFDCRRYAAMFGDELSQMVAVSRGALALDVFVAAQQRR